MTAAASTPAPGTAFVSDVSYPRNFVPQLAPSLMRVAAAMGGHTPPPGDEFTYCELGAGRGDTLVTLAAATPGASFVGVDLSADHVAFARELAERGDVKNVRLLEADFEDPELARALPDFDFIVAHGVVSWISPAKRAALFRFASAKLKPGGLMLASYNALPGWAAIEPLRRLMLSHAARDTDPTHTTLDRARGAHELAVRLAEAKVGYFADHPTALRMLDLMREGGLAYVVHEYLHPHWHPLHFAEVSGEARANGLAFAAQLPLYLNVRELALAPAVKDIAKTMADRDAYEELKDFASNELFRTDLYVKPRTPDASVTEGAPHPDATRAFFEGTSFGSLTREEHLKRSVRLPMYTLDFSGPVYRALAPYLCAGPISAQVLARQPRLAGLGAERIGQTLQNLCLGGQVVPMRGGPETTPGARLRVASRFNRAILEQAGTGDAPLALATPATGTGLAVSLLEALFVRLMTEAGPEDGERERLARAICASWTFPLTSNGTRVEDVERLVELAARELPGFERQMGAKLAQLGILEAA